MHDYRTKPTVGKLQYGCNITNKNEISFQSKTKKHQQNETSKVQPAAQRMANKRQKSCHDNLRFRSGRTLHQQKRQRSGAPTYITSIYQTGHGRQRKKEQRPTRDQFTFPIVVIKSKTSRHTQLIPHVPHERWKNSQ